MGNLLAVCTVGSFVILLLAAIRHDSPVSDQRWNTPSPIAWALAAAKEGLTCEQALDRQRKAGGRMTDGEWRQLWEVVMREVSSR